MNWPYVRWKRIGYWTGLGHVYVNRAKGSVLQRYREWRESGRKKRGVKEKKKGERRTRRGRLV